jgi:methyl-accepting chemotaxis protein
MILWFGNLKTMTKLLLGFTVVGGIMAFVGALALSEMKEIFRSADHIYNMQLKPTVSLMEVKGKVYQLQGNVFGSVLEDFGANRLIYLNEITQLDDSIKKEMSNYKGMIKEAAVIEAFEKFQKTWDEYKQLRDEQVLRAIKERHIDEAKASMHGDVAAKYLSVLEAINRAVEAQGKIAQEKYETALTTFGYAKKQLTVIIVAGIALGLFLGWIISRGVTRPLKEVSSGFAKMAAGDLTMKVPSTTSDEIGVLARAFNEMAHKLSALIFQVQGNTKAITRVMRELQENSNNIFKESQQQESAMEETSSSIEEMSLSIQEVNDNVELLTRSANDTSSSIMEMDANISGVASNIDSLSGSIDVTSSSIIQLISSIKKIAESLETLNQVAEETASSLHELNASVQQVEQHAQKSHTLSEKTSQEAEKGMESVSETMSGMKEIQSSFIHLQQIVSRLSDKSESIGQIIKVINEVAGQTNLLSLNAAIIAAQAGDYGKGFSVVAEEIKSLADQTASSTREIATLIKAVQDETANAVTATAHGSESVQKGVALSQQAGDLLKVIIESSHSSTLMVSQIVRATQEQANGIQGADQAMYRMKEMVQELNRTTHEQERASMDIMNASENMRVLGKQVKTSIQEQSHGSNLITGAVEKVMMMIRQILNATQEQNKGSERIQHAVEVFKQTTTASVRRATEMNQIVTTLSSDSQKLDQEISRFKIEVNASI